MILIVRDVCAGPTASSPGVTGGEAGEGSVGKAGVSSQEIPIASHGMCSADVEEGGWCPSSLL